MKILIVSPTFPPDNTPDLHRVRMMLPFLVKQGHSVVVLAVDPRYTEAPKDPYLEQSIPSDVEVIRVKALNPAVTRRLGLGNLAIRSFPFLWKEGNRIIRSFRPDIIFFSTTMFLVMPLGRVWKKRFNVPFILDFQDPWRNDYYLSIPRDQRPPKYWFIHGLNKFFERWTVPYADGILAVNQTYIDQLKHRYVKRLKARTLILPLGSPSADFDYVSKNPPPLSIQLDQEAINAVYTGVVPDNMLLSIEAVMRAVKDYNSQAAKPVKLYFIGTNYGPEEMHRPRVMPLAQKLGMEDFVVEKTGRVSYFEAIRLMQHADLLLLPGTTDAGYTPSKFYVYALAGKPVLALLHKNSPLVQIIEDLSNIPVVMFDEATKEESLASRVKSVLKMLLGDFRLRLDQQKFGIFTDSSMTSQFLHWAASIVENKQTEK